MFRNLITGLALGTALVAPAFAEMHEIKMLNKGDSGRMIFEPAYLQIAPGDTVKFLATDKGHNAESIDGMMPDGAEDFAGKINQEIEVTLDVEGLYGIKCKPHYAMGMVMTIAVGDDVAMPETFFAGRVPPQAKKRFDEQLSNL